MIITCKNNAANAAVGGKTARACDSCIKRRARWYCAADDAFLCQSCDFSVHSANPLARRHERVRLKTSSFKPTSVEITPPSWLKGFTKKARTRTRRHGKAKFDELHPQRSNPLPLVPEFGSDEVSHEENEEEQLLYRVPIYDPLSAELCTSSASNEAATSMVTGNDDVKMFSGNGCGEQDSDCLHGFFPSDMDIAEFAADVESLLGKGLEDEPFGMEELGLIDEEKELNYSMGSTGKVKVEDEEDCHKLAVDDEVDIARETFELNFDYESPLTCEEEDDNERIIKEEMSLKSAEDDSSNKKKRKILLTLDYEAVMTAWASQGSPWTTGDRPEIDPDECWPDYLGADGTELLQHPYGDYIGIGTHTAELGDGGREARVSRYREKRRTRLFSKKIRYEVRKLNAEKRPRMKGRFVKRTSFAGAPPAFPLLSK